MAKGPVPETFDYPEGRWVAWTAPKPAVRIYPKSWTGECVPGFNSKDHAARDIFAFDIRQITDKQAETVESMLRRFDNAIQGATADASQNPELFQGSDQFLARKIAKEESKLLKQRDEEYQEKLEEAKAVVASGNSLLNTKDKEIKALQARLHALREEAAELEEANNHFRRVSLPLSPLSAEPKPEKERIMSKRAKIAAGLLAAAVLGPMAFKTAASGWGEAYAAVIPDKETAESQLAELFADREDLAERYADLQIRLESEQERDALKQEIIAAFMRGEGEVESALSLAANK